MELNIINTEQPIGRILSNTGKGFLVALNKRLSHLDIDRNYYALLIIEEHNGNLTQQELSHILGVDKVSVVRIIDYLSAHGYVTRTKNATDKRKYSIVITDKAAAETENIRRAIQDVTNKAFAGVEAAKIKAFKEMLTTIKQNLTL